MRRILWLVAMAALTLASSGAAAMQGSMPIIDAQLQSSVNGR